ncbi:MAG TPA: D-alanyl-D-alanine carboxypeptidase family protein [Blastocatellia bacterium]|jgi:hypothetical protein
MLKRALIILFITVVSVVTVKTAGQSNQKKKYSGTKPIVRLSAPDRVSPEAATKNSQLQTDLEWGFGGKTERGWYLYLPLISNLIGANEDPASRDFARALARWQADRNLEPSGVLDTESWKGMVSFWQSRRINSHEYPSPDQLVTIPVEDCYDPGRPLELRQAERRTYEAYKKMTRAAARDLGLAASEDGGIAPAEKFLKIISAFRSRDYQDELRRRSPNSTRAGLAVNSPHFTGRALDIYVGGEPVSTKYENRALQTRTPAYRWLVKNASRYGFQPYFYEPWHWEYVGKN